MIPAKKPEPRRSTILPAAKPAGKKINKLKNNFKPCTPIKARAVLTVKRLLTIS